MTTMTPDEFRAGLERHGAVMEYPRRVDGAGWYAAPNLARVLAGDPDPWRYVRMGPGGLVDIQDAGDRGVYIGGLEVGADDLAAVLRAAKLSREGDRHDPRARVEAGRAALKITDAMVRARVLDAVGGWAALFEGGTIIDDDPEHGCLLRPDGALDLLCLILMVRCPSTGMIYALRVGAEHKTAREARLWTLGMSEVPEVET